MLVTLLHRAQLWPTDVYDRQNTTPHDIVDHLGTQPQLSQQYFTLYKAHYHTAQLCYTSFQAPSRPIATVTHFIPDTLLCGSELYYTS